MFNNNKILVVIPARGSSKGIPRKNMRLLNNKPLISYSIAVAKACEYVDDVVVTTDDSEIALIADKLGVSSLRRSEELSKDDTPIDAVVYDAMIQKEKQAFDEYDIVITIQPNSPLLKIQTLKRAIEKFEDFSVDSVISVVDDRHLNWGYDGKNERYFPLYIERLPKDKLPLSFRETGAILASRRAFINEDSRLGLNIDLIEVSKEESVDISNFEDWWIAENYLQKKRIAIIVNAYNEIGEGHLHRCLSIASKLVFHDVLFLLDENHQLGVDIVGKYDFAYKTYDGEDNLFEILNEYNPQMVMNDILDTTQEYILKLKNNGYFVVNFEDLGVGSNIADIVFDAFYEHEAGQSNVYSGYKYYILKDEFYFQPNKIITHNVDNILIDFGVSDSNNLTEKVLDAILCTNYEGRINIILGLDYPNTEGLVAKVESNPLIQVYTNVRNISEFMFKADIIFSSANKSIYEICSMGIPAICLCQDEREQSHVFANKNVGFINMGLGSEVGRQEIIDQFIELVNNYDLRCEMNKRMLSMDLKNGFENMWPVIQREYRKFTLTK